MSKLLRNVCAGKRIDVAADRDAIHFDQQRTGGRGDDLDFVYRGTLGTSDQAAPPRAHPGIKLQLFAGLCVPASGARIV